jgi:hypothetical protein
MLKCFSQFWLNSEEDVKVCKVVFFPELEVCNVLRLLDWVVLTQQRFHRDLSGYLRSQVKGACQPNEAERDDMRLHVIYPLAEYLLKETHDATILSEIVVFIV